MSETVVDGSGSDRLTDLVEPHEHCAQAGPEELDEFVELAELDDQLIALVLRRARRARDVQLVRRTSGRPMSPLARENEMLRRYAQRLGREGTAIALAVLALSRRH
ncbi:chorismate mutase [Streptomyces sp. CA-294286]|uniref:chorismate mutase n=1 Tax=Streptomyces sp. CA-294286 TaxID=3240070 RepID=UPI003D920A02